MKKKILLFLACVTLTAVAVFNAQLVMSDSSFGSDLSLNLILKISSAQAEKDSTKIHPWTWDSFLEEYVCTGTGSSC